MREPIPAPDSRRPRTRAVFAGAAIAVVATAGLVAAMMSSLALADQPGTPLTVPGVTVATPSPALNDSPVAVPSADPTGAPSVGTVPSTTPATPSTTAPAPELVPAPTPVVVDDHGGNRSGGSGSSGGSTSGSSGGSTSGSSGGSGKD
ncbi:MULTISPECIES: hypothetical protein [unclassified Cryobacterium]|uniref:hypothetical protein n=1 Tax=unclassified Cryobacterium TaxID=2649013 RepID=UPI002AB5A15F|nr:MULTISPECIES: hypothetical protein [unclassified Cryobacterium]MDY7543487.1 hypothetical protein [Cryobacterium sp. 5B3]MEA9999756.1 hypothetical protein [Cryobacterium sp. RTS3]MEB0267824.1 hypothetical protein [Cryobacterium sp. 10I5]MEB0273155.1 hypothetical protein [Cryobacterium sp. 5B3]